MNPQNATYLVAAADLVVLLDGLVHLLQRVVPYCIEWLDGFRVRFMLTCLLLSHALVMFEVDMRRSRQAIIRCDYMATHACACCHVLHQRGSLPSSLAMVDP